ncbi:competence protein CoiA family protein [Streptomyces scabiei]|uniref:competence protein CoiA family protein n=1 Tax=Streptomyces scabiei TaxID=1930 RepID=UPI00298FD374|nr:competence protein CoiA family protein [Streptomyces scabiei]MDW8804222.1 competence protein CoiA family protein [Streptomyces scabiei]
MTSFPDEGDTRKVQTAVIGSAGSDVPVFLPYDHDEFDTFMRGRSRDEFYCGTLLGGCGKKLTPKRYTEKKCHFAHRPPVHCRRTANGESSADHLYIGRALAQWLVRQNHRKAKASYRAVGDRPGGTVDFRLSGGRQFVRVQLARLGLRQWQQEAEDLANGADGVEWLFGPDSMLAYDRVKTHGYAIRVECRTVGATREVRVGTQLSGGTIEWTTLAECSMTREGIVTPSLVHTPEGIMPRRSPEAAATTAQVSFQLADDTVAFTGAVLRNDVRSPAGTTGRVYDADIQPVGAPVLRARIVLPSITPAPNPSRVYLLGDGVTLTPLGVGAPEGAPAWLILATRARRLDAREAAAWNGLKPTLTESAVTSDTQTSRPTGAPDVRRSRLSAPETVASLRQNLERIARSRGRVTWPTLARAMGDGAESITPEHRLKLLVAMDFPRAQDRPVLSSLLTTGSEGPASFFADVLTELGWPGLSSQEVHQIHLQELDRAYRLCGARPAETSSRGTVAETSAASARHPQGVREPQKPQVARGQISPAGLPTIQLVLALREHLRARAKNGAADVTWRELSEVTGFAFRLLSDERCANLLFRVDEPLQDRGLMYAALIVADDGNPLPYFAAILQRHGRPAPGLPSEVHWARQMEVGRIRDAYTDAVRRQKTAGTGPSDAASAPETRSGSELQVDVSEAAAIGTLTGLSWKFDKARRAGDLAEAKRIWQEAGRLYGGKLTTENQAEHRNRLRDMSEWVQDRENENVLAELRPLLDNLAQTDAAAAASTLRDDLNRAKELKRKYHGKLPEDLQAVLRASGERLDELTVSRSEVSAPEPETARESRPSREKLSELAAVVRAALEDAAHGGTTTTWSAIRHRPGADLPHLHPDDQGEILVLVDADTSMNEPLLSALVTTNNGEMHPLYRHVSYSLGRELPLPQDELHAQWQLDVLRLYGLWKHR